VNYVSLGTYIELAWLFGTKSTAGRTLAGPLELRFVERKLGRPYEKEASLNIPLSRIIPSVFNTESRKHPKERGLPHVLLLRV
jgi:hypothetical protein